MLSECSRAGGAPGVLGLGARSSDTKEQEVSTNTEWESHLRHLRHLRHRGEKFSKLPFTGIVGIHRVNDLIFFSF